MTKLSIQMFVHPKRQHVVPQKIKAIILTIWQLIGMKKMERQARRK